MGLQAGSAGYFTFVAAVFFLYWAAAQSRLPRLGVVLLANYFFCARYGLFYIFLIPACSTVDYIVGLGLMRFRRAGVRRALVGLSLAVNLTLLMGSRGALVNPHAGSFTGDWVFRLGLSFYTFQALTYTLDLYRRDAEGTRSLLAYLSAVSFFPTLQAGPITRVTELISQLEKPALLSRTDGGRAFFLIGLGLLKKAFIADFLAENLVNRVFDTPNLYSGAEALIAVYAYSLQLYYDFSGYTDIARGTALLLGIQLPINFDRPYQSTSVTEFWRRWHISFSNWLRDYLYFSLPGARTKVMPYVNLVITMLLGGLWHGLTWTFAIWGLLHGTALAATRAWQVSRGRRRPPLSHGAARSGGDLHLSLRLPYLGFLSRRQCLERASNPGPHRLANPGFGKYLDPLRRRAAAGGGRLVRPRDMVRARYRRLCGNSVLRACRGPGPGGRSHPIAGRARQRALRLFAVLRHESLPPPNRFEHCHNGAAAGLRPPAHAGNPRARAGSTGGIGGLHAGARAGHPRGPALCENAEPQGACARPRFHSH